MLRSLKDIMGYKIEAKDGDVGKVHDFFYDDANWKTRYLVADTGNWLPGRRVLISPESVHDPDGKREHIGISLTKEQIENSPPVGTDAPVSRQKEIHLAEYYGWPPYWPDVSLTVKTGGAGPRAAKASEGGRTSEIEAPVAVQEPPRDPHLRSARETMGYHISSADGGIGHVMDFILEDDTWEIRYLVVDTRDWFPGGKKVLIAPGWINGIDWKEHQVGVSMTMDQVKNSPEFHPSEPINREYEARLYDYYGRPHYWER